MLWAEPCEHPSACSNQKFADQKRNVSQRAVGSFLTRRRDRRRVFIDAGRIKSFADGKDRQVNRRHDVVRMNCAAELQITVTERMSERAVCRRHEPIRRQNHDENSDSANEAAYDQQAIRRDTLSAGPHCLSPKTDEKRT